MIHEEAYTTLPADIAALAIWLFLVGTLLCIWAMQEIGNRITSSRTIKVSVFVGLMLLASAPVVAVYSHNLGTTEERKSQ